LSARSNRNADIYLNGRKYGSIKAGKTKNIVVPIGKYKVTLKHGSQTLSAAGKMKRARVARSFVFKAGNKKGKQLRASKDRRKKSKIVKSSKSPRKASKNMRKSKRTKKSKSLR
jgi:hypothetical protein